MRNRSHGSGAFRVDDLAACGEACVIEPGVLVFHPENVRLGRNVYVGHGTMLKGYYDRLLEVGDETWIGQQCFLHAAGGIRLGVKVGIGPGVRILTSQHAETPRPAPIIDAAIERAPVVVEDGADIGVGAIIMPGVTIGQGAQVGAGAVVTANVPPFSVVAGVPARVLRERP